MAFDRTNTADLSALKGEVTPANGYAPEDTGDVLARLNDPAQNRIPASNNEITPSKLRAALDTDDLLPAITAGSTIAGLAQNIIDANERLIRANIVVALLQLPDGDITGGVDLEPLRSELVKIFGPGTNTRANFAAFARPISRAEAMFGTGTVIGRDDWFAARDS